MTEDSRSEPDLANYLTYFRQHVQKTHSHLQGHDPSSPLPPFYTESPTSYWTSAEKSAFFHALSLHSRLRPDLISECVKTKNVVDVCAYMDMLEDGVRREGGTVKRSDVEAAMEVSDRWIELEEENAAAIIDQEAKWEEQAANITREKEKEWKKKMMPKAKWGEAKNSDERKRERVELRAWRKEHKAHAAKDALMRSLNVAHLKVIDNILREEEEMLAAPATSRQNTAEPLQPPLVDVDEEMIDPVLRSNPMPIPGPSTSMPSTEPVASFIPENFSPASRRRLKKRLYMRRKRAEAVGETDSLPVELLAGVERVKPGRKSGVRQKPKATEGRVVVKTEEDDDEEDPRHPHVGGKTLRYKIKHQLKSTGTGAEQLHENGLGLFHLSTLSKLMRMYSLLYDVPSEVCSEISADAIQFLHAHVVQYITELVHRAIVSREQERDMKAHTKVWRFRSEKIVPRNIEHAIEMAGTASFETKESFLAGVLKRLDVPSEAESDADVLSEDDEQDDEDVHLDAPIQGSEVHNHQEMSIPALSLHRGMYTPLVRIPSIIGPSKTPYWLPSASTCLEPEDALLPEDIDKETLAVELREEEEFDAQDQVEAEQNENMLWGEFGQRRTRGAPMVEDPEEEFEGHDLRFRAPGIDSNVKSQVYVLDSDP